MSTFKEQYDRLIDEKTKANVKLIEDFQKETYAKYVQCKSLEEVQQTFLESNHVHIHVFPNLTDVGSRAAKDGNKQLVEWVATVLRDVSACWKLDYTTIMKAAHEAGHEDIVKHLINEGANSEGVETASEYAARMLKNHPQDW